MLKDKQKEQLPNAGEIYLDHVGWMVADMTEATNAFEHLGFDLTPYSPHTDRDPVSNTHVPMGTANRLVLLESGYLEILTPVDGIDTPVARHMRNCIARHTGVHLIAFTVANAEEDAERVAAAGFELQPTVHLRRKIEDASGNEVEVAFTVMRARFDAVPEARIQILTHHTPEAVWQRRYMSNALGITGLTSAWLATQNPAKSADGFARFTGKPAQPHPDGGLVIRLDRGELRFLSHAKATAILGGGTIPQPPNIVAIGLECESLDLASKTLANRQITILDNRPDRIVIADAMGTRLLLQEK